VNTRSILKFNTFFEAAFKNHVLLIMHNLPFDLATGEGSKSEFKRVGQGSNLEMIMNQNLRKERGKLKES
jgi:hypothetical protein